MELTEDEVRDQYAGWMGPNPYYVMIVLAPAADGTKAQTVAEIDLDQTGWAKFYERFMRAPGQWYLVRKEDRAVVATMMVYPGEQPYYVARHVGYASTSDGEQHNETINYGIGKKRLDGHVDRIWIMANGCVTLGDDVEPISLDLLKSGML